MDGRGELLDDLRVLAAGRSTGVRYAAWLLLQMGAEVSSLERGTAAFGGDQLTRVVSRLTRLVSIEDISPADFDVCLCDESELTDQLLGLAVGMPLEVVHWPEAVDPKAYGTAVSCLTGASWAIGTPGRPPLDMPDDAASYVLGVVLAGAVIAAGASAEPGVVRHHATKMLEGFIEQNATSYRLRNIPWQREGTRASRCTGIFPYGIYDCSDGQVSLMGRTAAQWEEIATALGVPELARDYPDPIAIVADDLIEEVDDRLRPRLMTMTRDELAHLAESTGVLIAPVADLDEVLQYDDPLVERMYWIESPDLGRVPGLPLVVTTEY